ncbi:recombinase family protein [Escherichia coli]|nr:recombinase family protein [Escherichia coli]ELH1122440.1 recombinase family protein [Escherichia coli]MCF2290540.1 recombinase family protein [Escherichia coli]QQG57497.1 recombinase family protein [Escherichia coli]CAI6211452.1 recombinase family protein [Escherichia coli]
MLIGYIRVSTNEQNTALQRNALECAGCELIFEDNASGKKTERPGLKKVLRTLSEGDIGRLKGEELAQYNLWLDYLDALELVDTSGAPDIEWPTPPAVQAR